MNLVTLDEARNHIRTDSDADDAWLNTWIPAISQAVLAWLKEDWRAYEPSVDGDGEIIVDSNDDPIPAVGTDDEYIVKPIVAAACLVELAQQYRFRDGSGAAKMESLGAIAFTAAHGYILGQGATSLLSGLRKGTVR